MYYNKLTIKHKRLKMSVKNTTMKQVQFVFSKIAVFVRKPVITNDDVDSVEFIPTIHESDIIIMREHHEQLTTHFMTESGMAVQ